LEEEVLEIEGRVRVVETKEPGREECWIVNIVEPKKPIPPEITKVEKVAPLIEEWSKVFPREETLACRCFNVPSLIVRCDYTIDDTGPQLYEIEDYPRGIGLGVKFVPGFREKLESLGWKKVTVIIANSRKKGGDHHLWAQSVSENEISTIDPNSWIAPDRCEIPPSLRTRSIWPVQYKGHKDYLVKLGLAEEWDRKTDLGRIVNKYANGKHSQGIVFKSHGDRSQRVKILAFKPLMREVRRWLGTTGGIGTWRFGTIKEEVEKWIPLYIQQLHPPIKVRVNESRLYGIFRVFFGFSVKERKWKALGGFLNARASLLIHGASDALFVPIST
jgi:hypothetical protein